MVRRSRNGGTQLVKAGAGRWNAAAEARFLAEMARTCCAERAAEAAGFSTTTLYNRRKHYPDFAEKWRLAEEEAKGRLHRFVVSAGIATFDPTAGLDEGLPKVSMAEAIAILRLKSPSTAPEASVAGAASRYAPREPSIEEVRANILRKLDAIEAHERGQHQD